MTHATYLNDFLTILRAGLPVDRSAPQSLSALMQNLVLKTRADSPALKKAASAIEQAAWNELGYLNYTRPHYELYGSLLEQFADYQLCLVDEARGYPVAVANCVPLK